MGLTLNYYLNNDNRYNQKIKPIYLYIRDKGKTFTINTGERIEPKYWNKVKQRVNRGSRSSFEINAFLDSYIENIRNIIREYRTENPLATFDDIRGHLKRVIKRESKYDIYEMFENYINIRKNELSDSTIRKYKNTFQHLKEFEKNEKFKADLEEIDSIFLDRFLLFMEKLEISTNTRIKLLQHFKTFLKFCFERDYTKNDKFLKHKNPKQTEVENIAFNRDDIKKIIDCNLNSDLAKIRDVFLFQLYTGQRYSDILKFSKVNVEKNVWIFSQQKGKNRIQVPLIKQAVEILNKYDWKLPTLSLQKTNDRLKAVGRQAGLTEVITLNVEKNAKKYKETKPKYEHFTTHIARRTFISLSSYFGINQQVVKSMTGHKTDKMIDKYFKKDTEETRKLTEKAFNF